MTKKPLCRIAFCEMRDLFAPTDDLKRAFSAGFTTGQAEKVYLGACPAAMGRVPSDGNWKQRVLEARVIAKRYGLRLFVDPDRRELWIHRSELPLRRLLPLNSSCELDIVRGVLCGIPVPEIDPEFSRSRSKGAPR